LPGTWHPLTAQCCSRIGITFDEKLTAVIAVFSVVFVS